VVQLQSHIAAAVPVGKVETHAMNAHRGRKAMPQHSCLLCVNSNQVIKVVGSHSIDHEDYLLLVTPYSLVDR
jgi:hypothetical protein